MVGSTIKPIVTVVKNSPETPMREKSGPKTQEPPSPPKVKLNPVALALAQLGAKEKNGLYWIGNTPYGLTQMMKRYNRWRRDQGMEEILYNELWKAEP